MNTCSNKKAEKLNLCNSSLQFNAIFEKGESVWFYNKKCTIEFFDKTTNLYDLQLDDSCIIYTDVPPKYITKSV